MTQRGLKNKIYIAVDKNLERGMEIPGVTSNMQIGTQR